MTKPIKIGLCVLLAGILTLFAGFSRFGPCGFTPAGGKLAFGGIIAVVAGLVSIVIGFFEKRTSHPTP